LGGAFLIHFMTFLTIFKAIDTVDGKLKSWEGPDIEADSWDDAEEKIKDKPYLEIDGLFICNVKHRRSEINYK